MIKSIVPMPSSPGLSISEGISHFKMAGMTEHFTSPLCVQHIIKHNFKRGRTSIAWSGCHFDSHFSHKFKEKHEETTIRGISGYLKTNKPRFPDGYFEK